MGTYFSGRPFPCPLFSLAATASWSLDSDRSRWVVVPCVAGGPCFSEQLNIRYFSEHLSLMKFQNRFEGWPTKVRLVKAMVFPVVVYGCESWTVKKAERQRTDALECGAEEDSPEFLGLQDQTSPSQRKSVLNIHRKD